MTEGPGYDSGARWFPGWSNFWTTRIAIPFKLTIIWNASTVLCTVHFIKLAMFNNLGYKHAWLTWWPCVHGWGAVNTSTGMVWNKCRVACHPYNNKGNQQSSGKINSTQRLPKMNNSYPKGRIVVNDNNRTANRVHPVYTDTAYQRHQLIQHNKRWKQKMIFFCFMNYCISNYKQK